MWFELSRTAERVHYCRHEIERAALVCAQSAEANIVYESPSLDLAQVSYSLYARSV